MNRIVRIEEQEPLTCRCGNTLVARSARTCMSGPHQSDPRVSREPRGCERRSVVHGAVVDDYGFPIGHTLTENAAQRTLQRSRGIIGRRYHAHSGLARHGRPISLWRIAANRLTCLSFDADLRRRDRADDFLGQPFSFVADHQGRPSEWGTVMCSTTAELCGDLRDWSPSRRPGDHVRVELISHWLMHHVAKRTARAPSFGRHNKRRARSPWG